ncbi:MAG: hypothetical protein IJU76_10580 [Desulfovibrionaceae bacterium]|nr:hypothetical protein [Desulfovibrionaceae bacterium]
MIIKSKNLFIFFFLFLFFIPYSALGAEAKKKLMDPNNIFVTIPKKDITKHKFFSVTDISTTENAYPIRQRPFIYENIQFIMEGKEYNEGIIFDTLKRKSSAVCKLNKKYSSISFLLGHINGSDLFSEKYDGETILKVYYDNEPYPLDAHVFRPNTPPYSLVIPLKNCDTLKLEIEGGGGLYAMVDIILSE